MRKLHNEEFHNLYSSPSIIGMLKSTMRWARHVARMGRRGMHMGYWWERQGRRPLGRPRRIWVGNIKIALRDMGWDGMDWIDVAQVGTSGGLL
jgi:hypothetical protein